jgi:hypothetical protein
MDHLPSNFITRFFDTKMLFIIFITFIFFFLILLKNIKGNEKTIIMPWWYHSKYNYELNEGMRITWDGELGNLFNTDNSTTESTSSSFTSSSSFLFPSVEFSSIYAFVSSFPRYRIPRFGPEKYSVILINIPTFLSFLGKMAESPYHSIINSYSLVDYFNTYSAVDSGFTYTFVYFIYNY